MKTATQTPSPPPPLSTYAVKQAERGISQTNRPEHPLVQDLQRLLASSVVLFLNYKQYSWGAAGVSFMQIHDLFAGFAAAVKESFDEIAERLRMIGQDPIVTLDKIAHMSHIKQSATGITDIEMVEEADANAILLIDSLRKTIGLAGESDDPGSADLLAGCLRLHEKHEWILRQLLKGPGL